MANGITSEPARSRLARIWQNLAWWAKVLLVWLGTRIVSTLGFLWASSQQGPSYWYQNAHPAYFDFLNIWDVEWYQRIFAFGLGTLPGYPIQLPLSDIGAVQQNAWAFMPGFPMLVRAATWLTGGVIPWKFLAPTLSLLLSFALAIAVYKVFSLKLDTGTSLWGVALFGLWCASPVLQTGYAETLGILFLAWGLYFLIQHRYLASMPFLVGLSLTRPGMVSFALSLAGMWLVRWFKARSAQAQGEVGQEFPLKERFQLLALTAASAVLGLLWPLIAWIATGRADAYTATELAWRSTDPHASLHLMEGWIQLANNTFGPIAGLLAICVGLGLVVWLMFTPSVQRLGNELRLWIGSYFLYLLLVFNPQSSTFRILMPAFPLAAALAFKTKDWPRWLKASMIAVLIVLQLVWLSICWVYVEPDFTPP